MFHFFNEFVFKSKSIIILLSIAILSNQPIYATQPSMLKEQYNPKRALLAHLRGDYLHAGEEEALELIYKDLQRILLKEKKYSNHHVKNTSAEQKIEHYNDKLKILDLGCGLGSTADYFHKKGLGEITGIDIDSKAIEYAKNTYPNNQFLVADATNIEFYDSKTSYDIIYIINAFYAFNNQKEIIQALSKIAKPGTIVAIFDYSHINVNKPHGLKDLASKPMHPIIINDLQSWLKESNWGIIETKVLSKEFNYWYKSLLNKLEVQKSSLIKEYSQETFDNVNDTFKSITKLFDENVLGGVVIYAKYK